MNILCSLLLCLHLIHCVIADGFSHTGAEGTQHGRKTDDPLYYTTNSNIPHLPFVTGYMGTHGTYRFMTVSEQTLFAIGDAKHGVWRLHDNGHVREYRKKGKIGLPTGLNPNSQSTVSKNSYTNTIKHNYAAYIPEEGWTGYKYPDQAISDGSDGVKGHQNFIDLSIYHPKYGGKYNDHVPIDLPFFYCTMTGFGYPHVKKVWDYLKAQPNANQIGPLGQRAGFDIKENFLNLIRVELFQDAAVWANIGVGDHAKDEKLKNLADARDRIQSVNYQQIDLTRMEYEFYFVERPFFNKPYLFVACVINNKQGPSYFSYLRPDGAYFEELAKRVNVTSFNKNEIYDAFVPIKGESNVTKSYGLPLFGMHNPNRISFGMSGGACPEKGGDYARYPWGNPGSGWPTNYEEVTPVCDAFLVDIKLWANLDKTWNDPTVSVGNSGFPGKTTIDYTVDANLYGKFEDPYLQNKVNPHMVDLTTNGQKVEHTVRKPNPVKLRMDFTRLGRNFEFTNVSHIHEVEIESPTMPSNNVVVQKCENQSQVQQGNQTKIIETKECDWEGIFIDRNPCCCQFNLSHQFYWIVLPFLSKIIRRSCSKTCQRQ